MVGHYMFRIYVFIYVIHQTDRRADRSVDRAVGHLCMLVILSICQ